MTYENPLAYCLGLQGLALLRSFTGEYDRAFVDSRLAEIRTLLDDKSLADAAVQVARVDIVDGYRAWSRTYDGPNSAFDVDEPVIAEILDGLPAGDALDAACGTGRIAALLSERGHRVLGVDTSPDMLARARVRVPTGEFRQGALCRLPVADDSVDLVVCSLALTHVAALRPVFEQFARALRPGGHLVISDIHQEWVARGSIPSVRLPNGAPGRINSYRHSTGDYLRAALSSGFQVRRCEEPLAPATDPPEPQIPPRGTGPGPWDEWPWCLADRVREAADAANAGIPVEVIWHFQLDGPPTAPPQPLPG